MRIRGLDKSGDWMFGSGQASYALNDQFIRVNLKTRLFSVKYDCYYALQDGVDWLARLDVGQQDNLVQEIKEVTLRSAGIVRINKVDVNFNSKTRQITITLDVDTIFTKNFIVQVTQAIGG